MASGGFPDSSVSLPFSQRSRARLRELPFVVHRLRSGLLQWRDRALPLRRLPVVRRWSSRSLPISSAEALRRAAIWSSVSLSFDLSSPLKLSSARSASRTGRVTGTETASATARRGRRRRGRRRTAYHNGVSVGWRRRYAGKRRKRERERHHQRKSFVHSFVSQ